MLINRSSIIDAESFIKEIAKIDPLHMKRYNFEGFLEKESSEGYRQCVLTILQAYVEKRIAYKNSIGSIQGNLKHAEAYEKRTSRPLTIRQIETEEYIVKIIVKQERL